MNFSSANSWFSDVAIAQGRIVLVGKDLGAARGTINADGLLDRVSLYFPLHPGENDAGLKRLIEDIHG